MRKLSILSIIFLFCCFCKTGTTGNTLYGSNSSIPNLKGTITGWYDENDTAVGWSKKRKVQAGDKLWFFSDDPDPEGLYGELIWKCIGESSETRQIANKVYTKGYFRICEEEKQPYINLPKYRAGFGARSYSEDVSMDKNLRHYCAIEWPKDYEMQKYCIEKQSEAFSIYTSLYKKYSSDHIIDNIMKRCVKEWASLEGTDWTMVVYCIKKQAKAYRDLYQ